MLGESGGLGGRDHVDSIVQSHSEEFLLQEGVGGSQYRVFDSKFPKIFLFNFFS